MAGRRFGGFCKPACDITFAETLAGRKTHQPVVSWAAGSCRCKVHNMMQFMDPERVRAQLDRILASAAFTDAERASKFLRFVVLRALTGRTGKSKGP
jgi:hypothetical protein